MHTLANPRRTAPSTWIDSADALPSRRLTGIEAIPPGIQAPGPGNLALVPGIGFESEHARMLANPHLYDERDIEHAHEMWLTVHGLTEWVCKCGHTNLTPDAEFIGSACASCGRA